MDYKPKNYIDSLGDHFWEVSGAQLYLDMVKSIEESYPSFSEKLDLPKEPKTAEDYLKIKYFLYTLERSINYHFEEAFQNHLIFLDEESEKADQFYLNKKKAKLSV